MKAATAAGLDDFEHVDFEPVRLTDSAGKAITHPHFLARRSGRGC
jgi:hypothetical protein